MEIFDTCCQKIGVVDGGPRGAVSKGVKGIKGIKTKEFV